MTSLGLVALGVATVAGLVALDRLAIRVLRPVPTVPDRSVPDSGLDHEDVSIRSGSLELFSWLVRARQGRGGGPLLLMAHGWGASHGTVLRLAEPLVLAGNDVLLFDMRGHGRNDPAPFVTVRNLRDDVMAAVDYATERFPARSVVLVGHSFGGAAGILAAAEGARIDGLVLIAAPADVIRITAEYLSDKGLPGGLLVRVLRPFWWWRLGGTLRSHTPVRRITELHVPLLIIQPEHDQRVAREHAERLSAAAGVPYHVVPGREHTDVLDAPLTTRLVLDFVARLAVAPNATAKSGRAVRGRRRET